MVCREVWFKSNHACRRRIIRVKRITEDFIYLTHIKCWHACRNNSASVFASDNTQQALVPFPKIALSMYTIKNKAPVRASSTLRTTPVRSFGSSSTLFLITTL